MNDFWPTQLSFGTHVLPVNPLLEQAERLSAHTHNLVKAEVTPTNSDDGTFRFDFELVVRTLDYRFLLFSLEYPVEGYPAILHPYHKIAEELLIEPHGDPYLPERMRRQIRADSEEQLQAGLRSILSCNTTKGILQTLVSQAERFKR